MGNKRAIPQPTGNQLDINRAVKENLEVIMGQRVDAIKPLDANNAQLIDIALKVNELIARLQ